MAASPAASQRANEVFFSYAHADEALRDELAKRLRLLERQGVIAFWHDRKITAGQEWAGAIDDHLCRARIILLLVSADFLASDYCYDVEVQHAMARHEAGEARVIRIILRAVEWQHFPFGKLQALPTDGRPVTSWANLDEAFLDVARGIRAVAEELETFLDASSIASNSGLVTRYRRLAHPAISNIPYLRNPHFTGREKYITELRLALNSGRPAALAQTISGLGGVGKTQLAVEYAYRFTKEYHIIWWVRAEELSTQRADIASLSDPLQLPECTADEQAAIITAVRSWLEKNTGWLLIFDNANEVEEVYDQLPRNSAGHVLITSRNPNWRNIASVMSIPVLEPAESVAFLQQRTGQSDQTAATSLADALGDLPLALEQAGAYIEATGTAFAAYLELFQTRRISLWQDERAPTDYPDTVATTWLLSMEKVRQQLPAGVALLNICAYMDSDDIPRDVLIKGAQHLPRPLASRIADPLALNRAIAALRRYALIETVDDSLAMHRLLQAVTRDQLKQDQRKIWAAAAARLMASYFPDVHPLQEIHTWPTYARLLPHALAASGHAEALQVAADSNALLLVNIGLYLRARAQLAEAQAAYERALTICEATYGSDHATVATVVNNLGSVLRDLGDLTEARAAFERALAIDEAAYGPDHPNVAIRVNNLGLVLHDLGELGNARTAFERALDILQSYLGKAHPSTHAVQANLDALGTDKP